MTNSNLTVHKTYKSYYVHNHTQCSAKHNYASVCNAGHTMSCYSDENEHEHELWNQWQWMEITVKLCPHQRLNWNTSWIFRSRTWLSQSDKLSIRFFFFSTWHTSISRQSRSKTLNANWDLRKWKCPRNVMLEVTLNSLLTTTINNAIWQHIAAPNTTQSQMYINVHLTIHCNRFSSNESLLLLLRCSIVADTSTSPNTNYALLSCSLTLCSQHQNIVQKLHSAWDVTDNLPFTNICSLTRAT